MAEKIKNIPALRADLDHAIAARDKRVMELRAQGLSYAQVAAQIEAEGYDTLTRGRVAQIVAAAR